MKTVNDLYKMSKPGGDDNFPLLTDFTSSQDVDWWAEYVTNCDIFDFQFKQQFKTFVFYDQDPEDTDEEIMEKWGATIFSWLAMNDKRYSELYRIHVIPDDEAYALTYSGNGSDVMDYSVPKGRFKITVTMTSGNGSIDVKVHYSDSYGDSFKMFNIFDAGNSEVAYLNGSTSGTIVVNASDSYWGNSGWKITIEAVEN